MQELNDPNYGKKPDEGKHFFAKKGRDFFLKEGKKIGSVLEAIHFQQKI